MKKYTFLFLFSIITVLGFSKQYYISPNGTDSNNGSKNSPVFTLNKAWSFVNPGDTIYIRGGIYLFNTRQDLKDKSGLPNKYINVWGYPGEKPILTRTSTYYNSGATIGIYVKGNYLYLKDLEITGFNQISTLATNNVAGLWVTNSSNCIFENLNIHDNGTGMRIADNSGHNRVINSDFYCNQDPYTSIGPYENADGLQIAFLTGVANNDTSWVTGCRFWWNTDDGFDCFNNSGVVIIDNCWSFWNGYIPRSFSPAANGNGFKLGPTISMPTLTKRIITRSVSYKNKTNGFESNNARCRFQYFNNIAYLNGWRGFKMADDPNSENLSHIAKNNIALSNSNLNSEFSPASDLNYNTFLKNNVVNAIYSVNSDDFVSLTSTGIDGPRQPDGSLPVLTFLQLDNNSDLIDGGINVGLPYFGTTSDLGPFESNYIEKTLNIKVYFEGLFNGKTLRKAQNFSQDQYAGNIADIITVELHDFNDYSKIVYSQAATVNIYGDVTLTIPSALDEYYFITIKHRNSIETTSSSPVSFLSTIISYDFTLNKSKAYGSNLKKVGTKYVIYCGDINQDGIVDGSDMAAIDNASTIFTKGYIPEDLNCNGSVDAGDMAIADNNITICVIKQTP